MSQLPKPQVPEGLRDLMKDFTKKILKEKPIDIYDFAENYFLLRLSQNENYAINNFEENSTKYDFSYIKNPQRYQIPVALVYTIIPQSLTCLIKDLIKAVLREQPQNLCEFAVEYFRHLKTSTMAEHKVLSNEINYTTYENYFTNKEHFLFTPYVKCYCGRTLSESYTNTVQAEHLSPMQKIQHNGSTSQSKYLLDAKAQCNRGLSKDSATYSANYMNALHKIQRFFRRYLSKKHATTKIKKLSPNNNDIEKAAFNISPSTGTLRSTESNHKTSQSDTSARIENKDFENNKENSGVGNDELDTRKSGTRDNSEIMDGRSDLPSKKGNGDGISGEVINIIDPVDEIVETCALTETLNSNELEKKFSGIPNSENRSPKEKTLLTTKESVASNELGAEEELQKVVEFAKATTAIQMEGTFDTEEHDVRDIHHDHDDIKDKTKNGKATSEIPPINAEEVEHLLYKEEEKENKDKSKRDDIKDTNADVNPDETTLKNVAREFTDLDKSEEKEPKDKSKLFFRETEIHEINEDAIEKLAVNSNDEEIFVNIKEKEGEKEERTKDVYEGDVKGEDYNSNEDKNKEIQHELHEPSAASNTDFTIATSGLKDAILSYKAKTDVEDTQAPTKDDEVNIHEQIKSHLLPFNNFIQKNLDLQIKIESQLDNTPASSDNGPKKEEQVAAEKSESDVTLSINKPQTGTDSNPVEINCSDLRETVEIQEEESDRISQVEEYSEDFNNIQCGKNLHKVSIEKEKQNDYLESGSTQTNFANENVKIILNEIINSSSSQTEANIINDIPKSGYSNNVLKLAGPEFNEQETYDKLDTELQKTLSSEQFEETNALKEKDPEIRKDLNYENPRNGYQLDEKSQENAGKIASDTIKNLEIKNEEKESELKLNSGEKKSTEKYANEEMHEKTNTELIIKSVASESQEKNRLEITSKRSDDEKNENSINFSNEKNKTDSLLANEINESQPEFENSTPNSDRFDSLQNYIQDDTDESDRATDFSDRKLKNDKRGYDKCGAVEEASPNKTEEKTDAHNANPNEEQYRINIKDESEDTSRKQMEENHKNINLQDSKIENNESTHRITKIKDRNDEDKTQLESESKISLRNTSDHLTDFSSNQTENEKTSSTINNETIVLSKITEVSHTSPEMLSKNDGDIQKTEMLSDVREEEQNTMNATYICKTTKQLSRNENTEHKVKSFTIEEDKQNDILSRAEEILEDHTIEQVKVIEGNNLRSIPDEKVKEAESDGIQQDRQNNNQIMSCNEIDINETIKRPVYEQSNSGSKFENKTKEFPPEEHKHQCHERTPSENSSADVSLLENKSSVELHPVSNDYQVKKEIQNDTTQSEDKTTPSNNVKMDLDLYQRGEATIIDKDCIESKNNYEDIKLFKENKVLNADSQDNIATISQEVQTRLNISNTQENKVIESKIVEHEICRDGSMNPTELEVSNENKRMDGDGNTLKGSNNVTQVLHTASTFQGTRELGDGIETENVRQLVHSADNTGALPSVLSTAYPEEIKTNNGTKQSGRTSAGKTHEFDSKIEIYHQSGEKEIKAPAILPQNTISRKDFNAKSPIESTEQGVKVQNIVSDKVITLENENKENMEEKSDFKDFAQKIRSEHEDTKSLSGAIKDQENGKNGMYPNDNEQEVRVSAKHVSTTNVEVSEEDMNKKVKSPPEDKMSGNIRDETLNENITFVKNKVIDNATDNLNVDTRTTAKKRSSVDMPQLELPSEANESVGTVGIKSENDSKTDTNFNQTYGLAEIDATNSGRDETSIRNSDETQLQKITFSVSDVNQNEALSLKSPSGDANGGNHLPGSSKVREIGEDDANRIKKSAPPDMKQDTNDGKSISKDELNAKLPASSDTVSVEENNKKEEKISIIKMDEALSENITSNKILIDSTRCTDKVITADNTTTGSVTDMQQLVIQSEAREFVDTPKIIIENERKGDLIYNKTDGLEEIDITNDAQDITSSKNNDETQFKPNAPSLTNLDQNESSSLQTRGNHSPGRYIHVENTDDDANTIQKSFGLEPDKNQDRGDVKSITEDDINAKLPASSVAVCVEENYEKAITTHPNANAEKETANDQETAYIIDTQTSDIHIGNQNLNIGRIRNFNEGLVGSISGPRFAETHLRSFWKEYLMNNSEPLSEYKYIENGQNHVEKGQSKSNNNSPTENVEESSGSPTLANKNISREANPPKDSERLPRYSYGSPDAAVGLTHTGFIRKVYEPPISFLIPLGESNKRQLLEADHSVEPSNSNRIYEHIKCNAATNSIKLNPTGGEDAGTLLDAESHTLLNDYDYDPYNTDGDRNTELANADRKNPTTPKPILHTIDELCEPDLPDPIILLAEDDEFQKTSNSEGTSWTSDSKDDNSFVLDELLEDHQNDEYPKAMASISDGQNKVQGGIYEYSKNYVFDDENDQLAFIDQAPSPPTSDPFEEDLQETAAKVIQKHIDQLSEKRIDNATASKNSFKKTRSRSAETQSLLFKKDIKKEMPDVEAEPVEQKSKILQSANKTNNDLTETDIGISEKEVATIPSDSQRVLAKDNSNPLIQEEHKTPSKDEIHSYDSQSKNISEIQNENSGLASNLSCVDSQNKRDERADSAQSNQIVNHGDKFEIRNATDDIQRDFFTSNIEETKIEKDDHSGGNVLPAQTSTTQDAVQSNHCPEDQSERSIEKVFMEQKSHFETKNLETPKTTWFIGEEQIVPNDSLAETASEISFEETESYIELTTNPPEYLVNSSSCLECIDPEHLSEAPTARVSNVSKTGGRLTDDRSTNISEEMFKAIGPSGNDEIATVADNHGESNSTKYDSITGKQEQPTCEKDFQKMQSNKNDTTLKNASIIDQFINFERQYSGIVNHNNPTAELFRNIKFTTPDIVKISNIHSDFTNSQNEVDNSLLPDECLEQPCVKKHVTRFDMTAEEQSATDASAITDTSSLSEVEDTEDSLSTKTVKLHKPDIAISKMQQRQDSTAKISLSEKPKEYHFDETFVAAIDNLDTDEDSIVVNKFPREDTLESSTQSDNDVVVGSERNFDYTALDSLDVDSTLPLKGSLKHIYTIAGESDAKLLLKNVTIDESIKYIEPPDYEVNSGNFYMDNEISENIRRQILAYSMSEADSECITSSVATDGKYDDFNVSTALIENDLSSTETESTIVSAVTKIQAYTRGHLTRKSLGKSRVSSDRESMLKSEQYKASFGSTAITESLEQLVQEAAAKKIQSGYRAHLKRKPANINPKKNESLSSEFATSSENSLSRKRSLMLQRGVALQNNSFQDVGNISIKPESSHLKEVGTSRKNEKLSISGDSMPTDITAAEIHAKKIVENKLKWLAMRQNSMPVQIDSEVLRVIPKYMRKKIKSADNEKKKKISKD